MAALKGPGQAETHDGSELYIGIVHARWNTTLIEALISGVLSSLRKAGVKDRHIVIESVPGSYELPYAVKSISQGAIRAGRPFDAIIAVGVLIKGETMHFEYISDAVSHGLMKTQLDGPTPIVFGLLTALTEAQASARAGLTSGSHNHGEDWGTAAVELGVKGKRWASGQLQS